jgi:hypothetical protein
MKSTPNGYVLLLGRIAPMMLEEFAANLRQDVLARGEDSPNYEVDVFTEEVIEAMTDAGEADGFILCNCDGRGYKINAYNISSDGDCIDLFVTVYTKEIPPQRVSATEIDRHFNRLRGFFNRALTENFRAGLEEASPEFDAADSIHAAKADVTRGRLFLITDGLTSAREYEDVSMEGMNFSHHVWDIERIFRMETSGATREAIDVKFEDFGGRVVCICSADPAYEYATFLGYFPASLLVKIYERYGARLLERNVRSFLQARGKINRGIRDTILHEPQRFLAYNNGISATAEQIEYDEGDGSILFLKRASGFQVVNGGQTTASLYTAAKKDKADVTNIFVQVKLTVPRDPAAIDQLAPRISLYANSQNKVNTADFSANHPYHLKMEELSRTIWAPASAGTQIETRWYYERARGSYADAIARVAGAERKRWKIQHPVSQKFTKTDLAKFENTWGQKPHTVSRGAEKNFVEFMAELAEQKPAIPDESDFRYLIARAILFRKAEKLVHAQDYGGYRANIVTYSLAWLSHHTAQKMDLERIWRAQSLPQELEEAIRITSKAAYDHLVNGAQGGNVTEWAKKEKCWEKFRTTEIGLSASLLRPVMSRESASRSGENSVAGDGHDQAAAYARVRLVSADEWFAISGWAKETSNLQPWQRALAYGLGRLAAQNREPSMKQVKQGLKILDEVRRLGFRMN